MPRELVGWAPNQQVKHPLAVRWCDETEHYMAECYDCEWESPITVDRFQARRWALNHAGRCPGKPTRGDHA